MHGWLREKGISMDGGRILAGIIGAVCSYLADGMQIGKPCKGLPTDVGDDLLIQRHVQVGLDEVRHTASATVLHDNPQLFPVPPAALSHHPPFGSGDIEKLCRPLKWPI